MDTSDRSTETPERASEGSHKPFGPVAAAFLAAGTGSVVLGLLTALGEASSSFADKLQLSSTVGPLSGKTVFAVVGYLIAWAILGTVFRGKDPEPRKIFTWTVVLVSIGLVLTFPIFFQLFAQD